MAIPRGASYDLGRIPTRPLSFASIDKVTPKELVVDYANGNLYINDENGVLHEVSQEIINQVINDIKEGDVIKIDASTINITVVVPKPDDPSGGGSGGTEEVTYTLEEFSKYILDLIEKNNSKLNEYIKNLGDLQTFIQNIIITDDEGNVTVTPESIKEDSTHRFVTDEQISIWTNKADHKVLYAIIGTDWVGDAAPYTQIINITDINQNDTPIVDVKLDDGMDYDSAMAYLNLFSNVYRMTTHNGYVTVYSSEATETPIPIMLKVIR